MIARLNASASSIDWRLIRVRAGQNPLMVVGVIICVAWIVVSLFADQISPYDPLAQDIMARLQGPSGAHWFGTDQLGRDVLARVLYGGRTSLPAGLLVVASATVIGTVFGQLAVTSAGCGMSSLMRFTEVFMAFPIIILAMAIAAALGPSVNNAIIAMTVVWWPNYAHHPQSGHQRQVERVCRVGARDGASPLRILFRTILPNCVAPALVMATLDVGNAILIFAGLSSSAWVRSVIARMGRMVSDGIDRYDQWCYTFLGLAILTVVMALNFIGDGLRDLADPRTRKTLT